MDNASKLMKRPKRNETEEDIMRMQQEFLEEKAKNPNLKPAAQMVKFEKAPKKSLFAQSRQQKRKHTAAETTETEMKANSDASQAVQHDETTALILGEIHEKIVGDVTKEEAASNKLDIVLGDIIENTFDVPKVSNFEDALPFPKIDKQKLHKVAIKGKSIFASTMLAKQQTPVETEHEQEKRQNLSAVYGESSVIVDDEKTASEVHQQNLDILSKMNESQILAEREALLKSIDPALVALLAKKRKAKSLKLVEPEVQKMEIDKAAAENLPADNAAVEILQQSGAENWLHFDVVEKDKLAWMRDIPMQAAKLKEGEQFEARFDWKGVLLPYSTEAITIANNSEIKDERELYLHGNEPHRPGYTLQELFRLARSNVMQQRVTAFGAIAGILNIYNQGFYDHVLELPISKVFFLIRFGLDDNTPAMLEITAKALALLCYNETDETLLDFIYDNPNCHWQPILQVLVSEAHNDDDPTSLKNLQKQMEQLQMNANARRGADIKANVQEDETESKTSMSDFELAETDLMDCLLRTNSLQRIYFILHSVRAENSTVSSCLKLLIRLARCSQKNIALQIVNNEDLIKCLLENFLPGLERVDTMQRSTKFYGYPQYLCLKLMRVLISQNLGIAVKLVNLGLLEKLQSYLFSSEDIRGKLINVQIESLRILRCLLLLRVESFLYRRFLPAFRVMLEWHFNHSAYEVGVSHLIRQHAAALLAAISCYTSGGGSTFEISTVLGDILHNCCCNWFYQAKRHGIKEFSQITLLSAALHTITWYIHHCSGAIAIDATRISNFIEKYLREFLASDCFVKLINSIASSTSIVLRKSHDRRNVHPALPNVGAVIMHRYGPQLIIPQTYALNLLNAIWRLLELLQKTEELHAAKSALLDVIIKPPIIEPLVEYLRMIGRKINPYLSTNFFAKPELQFIFKLLCFESIISTYFSKAELLQIAYNFVCCLPADQIPEIEKLFERYIFNGTYLSGVNADNLKKWQSVCLELLYPHFIVVPPNELTLSVQHTQLPVLPRDWPYFQLKILLQNYIENVQQNNASVQFSEREVLEMTFNFVAQLENCNPNLEIVTPTEKLMYFMIAFMGPESQFLVADMRPLIERQLMQFYAQSSKHMFQFEASYEGKCKFENLYALFVDHFQAASYGDELFSSLVMVPLAQKYDNKWRRRVWSDYAAALRFLDCGEHLLIGGIEAYLQPVEQDESLVRAYDLALRTNLLRTNTLPYRIAQHHVDKFKEKLLTK